MVSSLIFTQTGSKGMHRCETNDSASWKTGGFFTARANLWQWKDKTDMFKVGTHWKSWQETSETPFDFHDRRMHCSQSLQMSKSPDVRWSNPPLSQYNFSPDSSFRICTARKEKRKTLEKTTEPLYSSPHQALPTYPMGWCPTIPPSPRTNGTATSWVSPTSLNHKFATGLLRAPPIFPELAAAQGDPFEKI